MRFRFPLHTPNCRAKLAGFFIAILATANLQAQSLIRDAEIEGYLKQWSKPVYQAAGLYADNVEMFLILDKELNASVRGGQNIFMHTGLLQKAKTPEQLLAVIAHETGHIAGGHLNILDGQLAAAQMKALAATIIGIGAAVATGDSSAGILGAAGGAEIATRSLSTFSRGQESAADQLAVRYLGSLGISAQGAAEFFRILENEGRFFARGNSYAATHPLTTDRISAMNQAVLRSPYRGNRLSQKVQNEFKRMQAKLDGFLLPYREVLQKYPEADRSIPARYARSIAVYRRGELRRALPMMDDLIREEPGNAYFHELKGQALLENGFLPEAAFAYEQAISLKASEPLFRQGAAHAYIEQSQRDTIQKGLQHANTGLRADREDATLWRLAATGYGKLGNMGWSALSLAERALIVGDTGTAIRQSKIAKERLDKSSPAWFRANDIGAAARQSRNR